jgi:hypothetical protein
LFPKRGMGTKGTHCPTIELTKEVMFTQKYPFSSR